ncbi:MAG TPA: alpha-amylase/4-alpha-glucanotransferase domain-containing protein [Planctomycetota bacterium]|nr:alpha-amylase/4-alpha-glucanotransferase domain-containing protein [Planctomycetota bacterium]
MASASNGHRLKLCMVLHAHQPVGNFDGTIEEVYNLCYLPFLQEFLKYPAVKVSLHYSGSLLVWLEKRHPEYFDMLRSAIASGQMELVGGGMYEPILPLLPERDRLGQIAVMKAYLEKHFHVRPTTFWLPERVWEQSLVTTLADAGVEALTLDDSHFKNAGWPAQALTGPFIGEDRGRRVTILPAVEKLRYLMPFSKVYETMDKLREWYEAQRWGGLPEVLTYADDTEKFGSWPKTYKHCYTDGWLGGFLKAVSESGDWLETIFESQAMNEPKRGVAYLPDGSYREMGEWALPSGVLANFHRCEKALKGNADFESLRGHLRGGTWRNFRNKYPEATRMYAKLMHVSEQVAEWAADGASSTKKSTRAGTPGKSKKDASVAQDFLYQGECNCAHWHGVFGGLYLPHLRTAIFENLIKAQNLAEQALYGGGSDKPYTHFETKDFDFDGYDEVYLSNRHLGVYVKPGRGGHITELDVRKIAANGIDTLARRYEAYHDDVARAVVEKQGDSGHDDNSSKSIHDLVLAKESGLEKLLQYDRHTRESCVDHVFSTMPSVDDLAAAKTAGHEQFLEAGYEFDDPRPAPEGGGIELTLRRTATADGVARLTVEKTILLAGDAGELHFRHRVTNAGGDSMQGVFGIENNFSMLAPDAFDRRYRTPKEKDAGPMITQRDFGPLTQIELYDDWRKLRFVWRFETPARVMVHPIRTVSQSEGGFESVYQSSAVYGLFEIRLAPGKSAEFDSTLQVFAG